MIKTHLLFGNMILKNEFGNTIKTMDKIKATGKNHQNISEAEATVKFAIFDAITSNWHKKSDPKFAEILRDEVFNMIFKLDLKWAVHEYMQELEEQP
jgi:hypothetical protein